MKTEEIRASLIEQLQRHGADVEVYKALIDDYCFFHEQVQEMRKDIEQRGRTFKAISSTGKIYDKDNSACAYILKYNAQMLKILQAMGLKLNTISNDDSGDAEFGL